MIGPQAGRAFEFMRGIEIWRETGEQFWRGMVVRIIMDLDMAGAHDRVEVIADLMAQMWDELPVLEKPRRPLDWPAETAAEAST